MKSKCRLLVQMILGSCYFLLLAGCCSFPQRFEEAFESEWTIENGLAFKAEIKQHIFRRGDRGEVELTVRNISGESMVIPRDICGQDMGLLYVIDDDKFEMSELTPSVQFGEMNDDDYMILPHGRYITGKRYFCIKEKDFADPSIFYFEDTRQGSIFELKLGVNYSIIFNIRQDEIRFHKESDKGHEAYTLKDLIGLEQWQGGVDLYPGEFQVVD